MEKTDVKLNQNSYSIIIEKDFKGIKNNLPMSSSLNSKIIIITDRNVAGFHLDTFIQEMEYPADRIYYYVIEAGEKSKCLVVVEEIYEFLLNTKIEKKDVIFALGGGVVGDITGFVAATYFRGISFVQVPTTLLAQVDSSIGGKTGVNYKGIKNIIGSFYQPVLVYININTLNTLPLKEIRNGLAETVVHGVINSLEMLEYIDKNICQIIERNKAYIIPLIYDNCIIKSSIVMQDQHDKGIRNILNFGHTYGHAIESIYEYKYAHGECVSMGTVAAFKTSVYMKMISKEKMEFIINLLDKIGLPTDLSILDWKSIAERLNYDKKMCNGASVFILPKDFGKVVQQQLFLDRKLIDYLKEDLI